MARIDDEVTYWCRKYGTLNLAQVIRGAMDWAQSDANNRADTLARELADGCEKMKKAKAVMDAAQACFDRNSPGIVYPAFVELLREMVMDLSPEPEKPAPDGEGEKIRAKPNLKQGGCNGNM